MNRKLMIRFQNVSKKYLVKQVSRYWARDFIKRLLGMKIKEQEIWALKNINLEVYEGESVGIIGENGAGKSTLLKLLSNVTMPTSGKIEINGKVSSLLELGAGFHPYLTGRENIYLNGTILGLSKKEIDRKFDAIVEFSGLKDFIDIPVMKYSSGMYIRLGFSIAVNLDPDILVIDEVLAVGDLEFQQKSKKKILEFKDKGKTIVLVSHDLSIIRELCSKVYWLKNGSIYMEGDKEKLTLAYLIHVSAKLGFVNLTKGDLTVIFDKGKLIIFWKSIELTKNNCVTTYFVTSGLWQYSNLAWWEIKEISDDHFIAVGRWKLISIEQIWKVKLLSGEEILWEVEERILAPVEIKNETMNLRVTDRYKYYETEVEEGEFPDDFHPTCAQRILVESGKEKYIKVKPFRLDNLVVPGLKFQVLEPSEQFVPQLMNTEKHIKSRDLQFVRINDRIKFDRGDKLYFKSIIKLEK